MVESEPISLVSSRTPLRSAMDLPSMISANRAMTMALNAIHRLSSPCCFFVMI